MNEGAEAAHDRGQTVVVIDPSTREVELGPILERGLERLAPGWTSFTLKVTNVAG